MVHHTVPIFSQVLNKNILIARLDNFGNIIELTSVDSFVKSKFIYDKNNYLVQEMELIKNNNIYDTSQIVNIINNENGVPIEKKINTPRFKMFYIRYF